MKLRMISLASYLTRLSENLTLIAIIIKDNEVDNNDSKVIKILFKVNISTSL